MIAAQESPEFAVAEQYPATNIENERAWDAYRAERDARIRKERDAENEVLFRDLAEPFPHEVERTLNKNGTNLTYIPVSEVITRLNRVFGVNGWSSEIIKCERDHLDPDFIVAHVRLTVRNNDWVSIQKDGFGGQKIKRKKTGEIVDLGDEFKGAVSDALKKAAQQFGIALYLSRTEEALELDAARDNEAHAAPTISPEIEKLWHNFMSHTAALDADGKKALSAFWVEWSDNAPKPRIETATAEDLEALIAEAIRLSVGGEIVDPAA